MELRTNSTSAEATLWHHLKARKLYGKKFRRQHSIENYIVDFYCPQEKLIVELDGKDHYGTGGQEYDAARDARLKKLGFRILRFENRMIFEETAIVLKEISKLLWIE